MEHDRRLNVSPRPDLAALALWLLSVLMVVACLWLVQAAVAQPLGVLPEKRTGQWTRSAHLWLARAMVAEAGWPVQQEHCDPRRDHAAIAWTLARRWRNATRLLVGWTFERQVRAYCAGLGPTVRRARQRWVQALPGPKQDMSQPPDGWPRGTSWRAHVPLWRATLRFAAAWGKGEVPDPTRGRAWHFGSGAAGLADPERSARAVRQGRWVRLRGIGTCNEFFALAR